MSLLNFFVGSSPYQGPHILILAVWAVLSIVLITLSCLYAKTEKAKVLVIKISAGVLLFATCLSRFIYNDFKPSFIDFLPSSFCSIMGFILPLFILFCKKDSKNLYYALFAGFIGGLLTILSGEDVGQLRVQNTIISYFYHGLMVTIPMLCVALGYCKPTLNKTPRLFIGMSIMVVYGVFTNQVFDYSNNMYLNSPLIDGTFLSWWVVGLLIIVISIIVNLIYEAITLKWHDQSLYKIYAFTGDYFKQHNFFKKKDKDETQTTNQIEDKHKKQ